jgi:hypothetical protein
VASGAEVKIDGCAVDGAGGVEDAGGVVRTVGAAASGAASRDGWVDWSVLVVDVRPREDDGVDGSGAAGSAVLAPWRGCCGWVAGEAATAVAGAGAEPAELDDLAGSTCAGLAAGRA